MSDPAPTDTAQLASAWLEETEALIRAADHGLSDEQCARAVDLAQRVVGRRRALCAALAQTPTHAAAEALMRMPRECPGRIEAIYRAFLRGARRPRPGGLAPHMLAFEFGRSRAANFAAVFRFVNDTFASQVEHLEVEGKVRYRFRIDPLFAARGGAQLRSQLEWLQPRLGRWAATRMWLNGWDFDRQGPTSVHAHTALMGAWLDWARGSQRSRRRVEIA